MLKKIAFSIGIIAFLGLVSLIAAQDDVMFNYQGRVKVQGQVFTGTGQFKFAIVNNAGNESLWSNDNTSSGGGEPLSSISISVSEGIFNVLIGDTSLGMATINRSIFNHPNEIKLRIWFSDGSHGFQQLMPDHKLVNVELLGMTSGSDDFTIYVNGATGNDQHNGLTPSKAKKTIQAAVDVLPERLKCNVIIDIANGIYREEVKIFGINLEPGKILTLLGDETWTPPSGEPSVRITGTDNDVSHEKVRDNAITIRDCSGIVIQGFLLDYTINNGVTVSQGVCDISYCKATYSNIGISISQNSTCSISYCLAQYNTTVGILTSTLSHTTCINCTASNNIKDGFLFMNNSVGNVRYCVANNNGSNGIYLNSGKLGMYGTSEFSNNSLSGIKVIHISRIWFNTSSPDLYVGTINNNSFYPINVGFNSYVENHTMNSFSGNSPSDTVLLYCNSFTF